MDIAVPSWVIPGTYLENLRFLDSKKSVEAVELLFFLYDAEVRSLLDAEWDELKAFRGRFRFTAHLPDIVLGEHEELVERLSPLVSHFVVHPYPAERAEEFAALLERWMERYEAKGDDGRRFLVENTQPGRLEAALDLLPNAGLCFDTGHWILEGGSPQDFVARYGGSQGKSHGTGRGSVKDAGRIGEVHLHGVDASAARDDGRLADHRSLKGSEAWLDGLIPFFRSFAGVVDLEVFSWAEAAESLSALSKRGLVPKRMQR
jgi:hypothetical protein